MYHVCPLAAVAIAGDMVTWSATSVPAVTTETESPTRIMQPTRLEVSVVRAERKIVVVVVPV